MAQNFYPRTTVPASESRLERAQTGGWGHGLGNNVCDKDRGVNGENERVILGLIEGDHKRSKNHAEKRSADAYKLARAKAKRARQATQRYTGKMYTPVSL